ncbi:MAG: amidase [Betaproteobacteria bacterium]
MALDRRRFLSSGLLWNAALASTAMARSVESGGAGKAHSGAPPFELDEISVTTLQSGFESGRLSSRAVTAAYLRRMKAIDSAGPTLRCVLEINPDALSIARELDRERAKTGPRGPLHGVPVLLKDNIDTADRMQTTAGSLALFGAPAPRDAHIVTRLRAAGAVILGKANLSEWANIRSTRSTSGWSARGGRTRNPYALDRNTSGSSSGSAAAVTANLCAVAIGTETDGSIVSPSSLNGIVGIKPTVGLVSRAGIIPIAHTQDTAGPMARSVRDAAIVLAALVGADADDVATTAGEGRGHTDYTRFLDAEGLRGARIGVARNHFGFHDGVDTVINASLETLRKAGATLVDPVDLPNMDKLNEPELTVLLYELKTDLDAYLQRRGSTVRSLQDVIVFNERFRAREMPYFGQELFIKAQAKGTLASAEYVEALATCRRLSRVEGIDALMDRERLDAIVAPTDAPAWLADYVLGDHQLASSSSAAAVAGYPSITVPAGFVSGLPVGISFFGRAWSEPTLLRIAYAFEQASAARRPPAFAATVGASG